VEAFDHEKLDVYRLSVELVAWVGEIVDAPDLQNRRLSALTHLDAASQSIINNIAEGNGKRSRRDRARFLEIARGSALECGACLDGLVARRKVVAERAAHGKKILVRVVQMLSKMIDGLDQ
jgi:four helix bundle protein